MGVADYVSSRTPSTGSMQNGSLSVLSPIGAAGKGVYDYGNNNDWMDKAGFTNNKGNDISAGIYSNINKEWQGQQDVSDQMTGVGKSYANTMKGIGQNYYDLLKNSEENYRANVSKLNVQASKQATDAQTTYDNSIKPGLVNAVEASNKSLYDEAGQPKYMTYLQAQDPNNSVAQSFRNFYNQESTNEGRTGMADVGIMQNLGAQAMANQMGGMGGAPMTGAQMQMMQGQNMSQAGQAFANVQQRQQNLRDQGIQQGQLQTQAAYERGVGERNMQQSNIQNLQNAQGVNIGQQQGLRNEMGGYGQNFLDSYGRLNSGGANIQTGLAGIDQSNRMGALQRQSNIISGQAGATRAMDVGALQASNAGQAGKLGALGGLLGSAGGMAGSVLGGGAGAQAGANANGGGIGGLGQQAPGPAGTQGAYMNNGQNYGNAQGGGNGGLMNNMMNWFGSNNGGGTNQQVAQQQQPQYQNGVNVGNWGNRG